MLGMKVTSEESYTPRCSYCIPFRVMIEEEGRRWLLWVGLQAYDCGVSWVLLDCTVRSAIALLRLVILFVEWAQSREAYLKQFPEKFCDKFGRQVLHLAVVLAELSRTSYRLSSFIPFSRSHRIRGRHISNPSSYVESASTDQLLDLLDTRLLLWWSYD